MKFKKIDPETIQCTTSVARPFGCMELWAGNEKAHRSLELAGLEADVIAVPSGADSGGDLSAVFSCSDNVARVVLADCVGHGYVASGVARHIHRLLAQISRHPRHRRPACRAQRRIHPQRRRTPTGPLRMTTVVTGTFDGATGEFNFAYAAHPRMLLWRARDAKFFQLGDGMENFPLGFITGEQYNEQSIRLSPGDMILAFSDGATEVQSPSRRATNRERFPRNSPTRTLAKLPHPAALPEFSKSLLEGIHQYRGGTELEDDITLLTLRRSA